MNSISKCLKQNDKSNHIREEVMPKKQEVRNE